MRLWAKILVGAFAVVVLFCLISGLLLVQSGAWNHIQDFGKGIMGISQNAKGIEVLNQKFPFQEPADGNLPEERLIAYIEVRKALKPTVEPYDKWMRAHQGHQEGDFRDAKEAIQMTAGVIDGLRQALEAQKMSPREFSWMDIQVEDALGQIRSGATTQAERNLLETMRSLSENPRLTTAERENLKAQIKEAEVKPEEEDKPETPNVTLCARYRKDLESVDLGEFGGMMVRSFAQSGHGRHRRMRQGH